MKWTLCYGLLFPFDQNTGQEMMIETKPEMNLKARNPLPTTPCVLMEHITTGYL